VNLLGQAYGAMAALPHLLQAGGGALIHVSSAEARRALPLQSAYTASKHGMLGFLDALRMEVQQEKLPIQVTNIMPASINTPFFDKALTRLGVKPQPLPPVYEPEVVAEAILYAAEHPVREMMVGGAGKMIGLMQRFSPAFAERALGKVSYVGQRTDEPKRPDAPNNLFWHVPGYDTAKGSFSDQARSTSLYTWFQTHPAVKYIMAASAVSAAALVSARSFRVRRGRFSQLSERINHIASSIAGRINREGA
jgi:hypothetical protein